MALFTSYFACHFTLCTFLYNVIGSTLKPGKIDNMALASHVLTQQVTFFIDQNSLCLRILYTDMIINHIFFFKIHLYFTRVLPSEALIVVIKVYAGNFSYISIMVSYISGFAIRGTDDFLMIVFLFLRRVLPSEAPMVCH